ncbi:MAG: fimbrillin family protein, partial [Muribaculaceae bacterium]|nr:fimbrillin family protein [Muribaculaceae bacterium]
MRAKLTYLFLSALAVGLMSSCASDDPEVAPSGAEMKFAPGNVSRSTDVSNIKDNPFVVFCDRKREDDQLPIVLMNNVAVTYNPSTGGWEYSNPQFWFPDNEHSFVAIHPASVVSAPDADARYVSSKLTFTYTLPADYRQTADILAATHRRRYTSGSTDEVSLRFAHMLSQISISPSLNDNIMGHDGYIEFYKLEVSGIKTKAAFSITPTTLLTADQTDDREVDVAGKDAEGSLTIEFAEPKKVTNNREYVSLFDVN